MSGLLTGPAVRDAYWVKNAFVVTSDEIHPTIRDKMYKSSADLKFTDTTLGGNFAINPLPQFSRFTDPRAPGVNAKSLQDQTARSGKGMGPYYSEAFDDNAQIIYMRMGQAQFNSLTTFFTGFYSADAGLLARTGRSTGVMYSLGRATGFIVGILSWKLLAVSLIGTAARYFMQKPASKFYYSKPAMPLYWTTVNTIINQIAVNSGVVPRIGGADQASMNEGYTFSPEMLKKISRQMPDIFRESGGINAYAVANRAQRMARTRSLAINQAMNEISDETLAAKIQRLYTKTVSDPGVTKANSTASSSASTSTADSDQPAYLTNWLKSNAASTSSVSDTGATSANGITAESIQYDANGNQAADPGLMEYALAEINDGASFVGFRVNATGQVSESFSSSVGDSDLQTKMNSMSSEARSKKFSFANGNIGGGWVGTAVQSVLGGVGDLVRGVGDSLEISGLATLGGAAFVDIPKYWQASSANLPRGNYSIDLIPTYGNPISCLIQMYFPLACLLSTCLPLSTGKQSYTAPFLCELYDQGRVLTRLGIVDSMTITRGVGNLGFNNNGKVLGIRVDFSVLDLSSIIHMPINQGFSFGKLVRGVAGGALGALGGAEAGAVTGGVAATLSGGAAIAPAVAAGGAVVGAAAGGALGAALASGTFDDDNSFTDYMNVLAGMKLYDMIYAFPRMKLALTRQMEEFKSWKSAAHMASFLGDTLPGQFAAALVHGTERR